MKKEYNYISLNIIKWCIVLQKTGINLDAIQGLSYEDYIKTVKNLGFEAVFSDMSFCDCPEKIADICAKHNIEYQTVHSPFKHINDMWLDAVDGDEMLKSLFSCVEHCHNSAVPITVVHISSGNTPPPISEIGKKRFSYLVEFAEKRNVKIAFENLRVPEYLEWAMNTFKSNQNVGFCWDTGHENCFTNGIEYMNLYGDRLLCTHIHDNRKIHNSDSHLIPFDGKTNFSKVAHQLKTGNYTGPLMLEVFARDTIYRNMSPTEYLKRAYNAVEKIKKLTLCEEM